jgi:uncharacterized protein YdaU (DUF1376 family)
MASEAYSYLYIGDYFSDTLNLSAREHAAFRHLLLHMWLHGVASDDAALAYIPGLSAPEWGAAKAAILPLLYTIQPTLRKAEGDASV